jgi:hypothetical protein
VPQKPSRSCDWMDSPFEEVLVAPWHVLAFAPLPPEGEEHERLVRDVGAHPPPASTMGVMSSGVVWDKISALSGFVHPQLPQSRSSGTNLLSNYLARIRALDWSSDHCARSAMKVTNG